MVYNDKLYKMTKKDNNLDKMIKIKRFDKYITPSTSYHPISPLPPLITQLKEIENYGETWICNWCEHEAQESEFFTLYGNCPKCKKYQSDKLL